MNERIKSLVYEAEKYALNKANDHDGDEDYENTFEDDFQEKFAELLIRECIEVIVRNEHATLNIDNFTNEKAQGIQLGLEFATIDIAEHFGIEE